MRTSKSGNNQPPNKDQKMDMVRPCITNGQQLAPQNCADMDTGRTKKKRKAKGNLVENHRERKTQYGSGTWTEASMSAQNREDGEDLLTALISLRRKGIKSK